MRPLDPNPVLARELRTTVRAPSFLGVLFLSAGAVAAVVLFAVSALRDGRLPSEVGGDLLDDYFAAATVLVALVSAVYAAGSVARDTDAGVVEALAVAGYGPWRTLTGKLGALWAVAALVLVAVSPASMVPLMIGGVAPAAILIGHAYLTLVSLWAIAFGLAVSTRMSAARSSAIVAVAVTLPCSVALLYGTRFMAQWANYHWQVPSLGAFWPATALAVGPDSTELFFLVLLPLLTTFGAFWYLGAIGVGPLLPPSEDKGRGVRLWVPIAAALLVGGAAAGRLLLEQQAGVDFGIAAMCTELFVTLIAAETVASEPLRRPPRSSSGPFGPGIDRAFALVGFCAVVAQMLLATVLIELGPLQWTFAEALPAAVALAGWGACLPAVGWALRRTFRSVAIGRLLLGGFALVLFVALQQTTYGLSAEWLPWNLLHRMHRAEWTTAAPPFGATLVAIAFGAVAGRLRRSAS